jgi:hypothetical protein
MCDIIFKKIKAKLGKQYKILQLHLNSYLKLSAPRRNFFKATIYSLPQFIHRISKESDSNFQKDEIRELLEVFPFFLMNISLSKEKWVIGKIDSHPFDVIIAPERKVVTRQTSDKKQEFGFMGGLFIQVKRLYKFPGKIVTFEEWIDSLRSLIEEKISPVDFGCHGHIHIYNQMVYKNANMNTLYKALRKLFIPYNKYVDSISLSIEMVNAKGETTVATGFIYPIVKWPISAIDLNIDETKSVYKDDVVVSTITKALIMPRVKIK